MSRDFELLQRVEHERNYRARSLDSIGGTIRVDSNQPLSEITEEPLTTPVHPSAQLASTVRSELSKLIFRTFLSTPTLKVVMFTGIGAEEGAKWIAACTADLLSSSVRGRVCLLDADFASPAAHRYFSIPNQDGLAAVLAGSIPIIRAPKHVGENLWIIPSGRREENPQITSALFHAAIVDLLDLFDYIIISAPDCDRYAEAAVIGAASDGAVLVLDAMLTRRAAAQNAKIALETAKIRLLGSVFNNRSFPVPEYLYSRL